MQGFERAGRQLLDAAALAGYLVPAGSMFAFLAGHRAQVFPDEELTRASGQENSDLAVAGEFLARQAAGDRAGAAGPDAGNSGGR